MLKYILLISIILLYIILYCIESLFTGDMIYHVSMFCSHLISILIGIAILTIRSFGKWCRNTLAVIVIVVSLWFVFNYVYVIVSNIKNIEIHLVGESDNGYQN